MSPKKDRRIIPINEQDAGQWEVLSRLFTKEEVEHAREINSITAVNRNNYFNLYQKAAQVASEGGHTAWARSKSKRQGARGSLSSFLMGFTRRMEYDVWRAMAEAADRLASNGKVDSLKSASGPDRDVKILHALLDQAPQDWELIASIVMEHV